MASILAAQLDELMGRDRNLAPNEKSKKTHWSDDLVCKHYLVEFCPYEVFLNTKFDIGYCEKVHDDTLRQRYKESSKFKKMGYEEDFLRFLENAIGEVDRKIKRGHARLAVNDSQNNIKIQQVTKENEEKIIVLQKQIDELLVKSEGLAEEGNVEEAQDTIKEVEKLNFERDKFKIEIDNAKAMERHMRVCEICGAFLIINDAPSRVDDHNSGKQHTGFVKVREAALRMREQLFGKDSKPRGIDDNIQNGNTGPSPVLVNDIKENETVKKRSRSKSKHESERHKSHKSSHKKSSSKSSHSSSRKERPHGSSRDEKREHGRHGHTQGESRRR